MRHSSTSILNACTGEQLLMLAIANAGLRPNVARVLDSRAKANRRRTASAACRTNFGQANLVLRRAG